MHFKFHRNYDDTFRKYSISFFSSTRAVRWECYQMLWVSVFLHYTNETFIIAHITHILVDSYCWVIIQPPLSDDHLSCKKISEFSHVCSFIDSGPETCLFDIVWCSIKSSCLTNIILLRFYYQICVARNAPTIIFIMQEHENRQYKAAVVSVGNNWRGFSVFIHMSVTISRSPPSFSVFVHMFLTVSTSPPFI